MSFDMATPRSRRTLLAAGLGGLAALVAGAFGRPTAVRADVDGDVVLGSSNDTTTLTTITNTSGDNGFQGTSGGVGAADGVTGTSTTGVGVFGISHSGDTGTIHVPKVGVRGTALHDSSSIGVLGDTSAGVGVKGKSVTGTGVYASSTSGNALSIAGKAHFSRSGRSTISAGHSTRTISLAGTTSTSKIFAVLASNRSGRHVRAVVPAAGQFKIYLNTTVSSNSTVAWFVLD